MIYARQLMMAYLSHFDLRFRMTLMFKPTTWKIKKCFTIYKSLLKELSLVELKVVETHKVLRIKTC